MDVFFNLADTDTNGDTPLHVAAKAGHYATLKELVNLFELKAREGEQEKNLPGKSLVKLLNEKNVECETVLHVAMKHADVDILKFLFQKGADVTIKDKTGNIPLHELVKSAEIDSREVLI